MPRGLTMVAAVAALAVAGPAGLAQEGGPTVRTTSDLAAFCSMDDRDFCFGYINGAGQFYQALVTDDRIEMDPFVCPGREVSEREAVQIFLDWYGSHQEAGEQPAIDGLFRAWVAAFPCE